MTYHNAIKYIKNAPREHAEDDRFEHVRLLCEEIGSPQKRLTYIRLAGSNGKTLCGGMLTSILKETTLSVGYLAMPLRDELCQNVLISSSPLSMDELVTYTETVQAAVLRIRQKRKEEALLSEIPTEPAPFVPTSSELLLAVALLAFREHHCALCLIESDHNATDPSRFLPPPIAAVICGTIPRGDRNEIAKIRSYISRGVQEIVSAPQNPNEHRLLADTCASVNCRLTVPLKSSVNVSRLSLRETEFFYKGKKYTVHLCGRFQVINALVALETAEMLNRRGYAVSEQAISQGLASVRIPAKFEFLSVMPFIIADSTHSPVAIETVCDSMAEFIGTTGNTVRLCLPYGNLPALYWEALTNRGYTVESIRIVDEESRPLPELPCSVSADPSIKKTVRAILKDLPPSGFLLISGTHGFAEKIRYELLATLGF